MSNNSSTADFFEGLTKFTHEVHEMALAVGPGWGLVFLLAILMLIPYVGLLPLCVRLFKEDRVDRRKQNIELERLKQRYNGRNPHKAPPKLPPVKDK